MVIKDRYLVSEGAVFISNAIPSQSSAFLGLPVINRLEENDLVLVEENPTLPRTHHYLEGFWLGLVEQTMGSRDLIDRSRYLGVQLVASVIPIDWLSSKCLPLPSNLPKKPPVSRSDEYFSYYFLASNNIIVLRRWGKPIHQFLEKSP